MSKELAELKEIYYKNYNEIINTRLKLKTISKLLIDYSDNSIVINNDIPIETREQLTEFIESVGLMLIDNVNNLEKLINYEGSK